MKKLPRETEEYIPFREVSADGVPVTAFDYAVTRNYVRPPAWDATTGWTPVDTIDGKQAFMLDGPALGRGTYKVWVRVTADTEHPVIEAGEFQLT